MKGKRIGAVELRIMSLPADAAVWDRFITGHPRGTVFHTAAWLGMLAEQQRLKPLPAGFFIGKEMVGALPLLVRNIGPLRVAASPFVVEDTPYLGLVADAGHVGAALRLVTAFQRRQGLHFLRFIQQEDLSPLVPEECGFTTVAKHTHLLDLRPDEETIWKRMEGRCRTAIRKGEKEGVTVTRVTDGGFMEQYYALLDQVYRQQGMGTPNPAGFYRRLWDTWGDTNLSVYRADWQGELIAAAIVLRDKGRAYYLNGASRSEYNRFSPNNLVQWAAIRDARGAGAERYDFVGSDIPRLARFKQSFGGELVTHVCLERAAYPWLETVRRQYPRYKRVVGRLFRRER